MDAFHWYTSHATVMDMARLSGDQVVYVHLNDAVAGRDADQQIDNERHLPGTTGLIDIVGFLQALDQIGFDGPVAVEPFDEAVRRLEPAERVRLAAESLARVLRQAGLHT